MQSSFLKGRENKVYIVLLATLVLLFAVFFTSRLWLFDDSKVMQSPFGKEITGLDQTKLKLMKWEYNPEKELMELSLEVKHAGDDVVRPTFTFTARERGEKDEYPVKVVYEDKENIVLQIGNVTEKYRVVGLFVTEHRDKKILEAEAKEKYAGGDFNEEEEVELTLPKPSETVVVGDYRKVKVNTELVTRGAVDYQIENVQREIDGIDKEMKLIVGEKIPMQEESIEALKEDIESLEEEVNYQVDEEKDETESKIEHNKEAIKKTEGEIQSYVELLEKRIKKKEKLLEKLEYISKESESEKEKEEDSKEEIESDDKKKKSKKKDKDEGESKKKDK